LKNFQTVGSNPIKQGFFGVAGFCFQINSPVMGGLGVGIAEIKFLSLFEKIIAS